MSRHPASPTIEFDTGCSRAAVFGTFVGVAAITVVLRIWYAGRLYQDDGLWFTAAEEILRGKMLYRDIFFDKPPALPLLYAGLFKIFGAHILVIRLFTICYSIAISMLLYRIGSRFYGKRTGLVGAVLFSIFSTTYVSGDMQSLNTDFLMVPFYSAGAFLMIRAGLAKGRSDGLAFAGGVLSGLAFQINPKGVLDLAFFAMLLVFAGWWRAESMVKYSGRALRMFGLAAAGFAGASIPFLLYIAATDSFSRYKLYVWDWGLRYAGYYPASRWSRIFLHYGTDYFVINNLLLISLLVVAAMTIRRVWRRLRLASRGLAGSSGTARDSGPARRTFNVDASLLVWFAVSFAGVASGGRFFAHYYFQAIPSLCLIGASGIAALASWLAARNKFLKAVVPVLVLVGLTYTLARTHGETVELAGNWMRGGWSETNREARIVAAAVRDMPDPVEAAEGGGSEALREGGPRTRLAGGSADFLFVWGNWPEVYYWSGLLPASGYLSSQPLTGVPADVWYGSEGHRMILDEQTTAAARRELAEELERTAPKYVVDELGARDARLSIERYPELRRFMEDYQRSGVLTGVQIYIRSSIR